MATQLLDTEKDVCRKYLHFSQRDLYFERFVNPLYTCTPDPVVISNMLAKCNYWRARYNAACAVEQAREESISDIGLFND